MKLSTLHRRVAILLATLWAGVCLALPAHHDIEQAVASGQLPQAERMLREVIAEKPRSARARYELAQVLAREGQHEEVLQAIHAARELDPSLKFAQSPDKFNAVAHAIEQKTTAPHAAPVAVAAAAAPQTAEPARPAWWWPAVLSAGFALLVLALWRRMAARPAPRSVLQATGAPTGMGAYASEAPRGFGAQYDPRGPAAAYGTPYPAAGYPAPSAPSPGSGVAGAVVGGLAGVAAGYALSRALEGHNASPASTDSHPFTSRPTGTMEDIGLVRMDDAAQDSGLGSFDGGAGDDWGPSGDDSSW